MKHLRGIRPPSKRSYASRPLRFDVLEERRLFAGLEGGSLKVLVFEDPLSVRTPGETTLPAAERVVFVDLNRDGFYQSREPWAVTDAKGIATLDGLSPGSYSIRLLGNQRSTLETTSPQPAEAGEWSAALGVRQALDWESDTVGWFAANASIQKWDLAKGELIQEIDLEGSIQSVAALDSQRWVALVQRGSDTKVLTVNRVTATVESISANVRGINSITIAGEQVFALAANSEGSGVYRLAAVSDVSASLSTEDLAPEISGLSAQSSIHTIGSGDLVTVERLGTDARVSSWRYLAGAWQLVAERMFSDEVRFASALSNSSSFAIETPDGLAILNNTIGLPMLDVLEQAQGPAVFDASRGVLLTQLRGNPGRIVGWSALDWNRLFDFSVSELPGESTASAMQGSLGYLRDSFISVVDGRVYRHSLAVSTGTMVAISEGTLKQIAIGVRSRGNNTAPSLEELPDFATDEDTPVAISQQQIATRGTDLDGDTLYYFVRSPGDKGKLQWSSTSFAVFVPSPDANGEDRWTVQAFDGRSWSQAQSFRIDIRPVNDLPSELAGSSSYNVPELEPGAVLGRLEVKDPDADAVYRYVVSDGRFVVANGMLSLAPGVALDYEAATTLVVSVTAVEVNQRDAISKAFTVHVQDRNDPPQGIVLTGNGSVPEKKAPYVVGNIGVIDQDRSDIYDISVSDSRFEVVGSQVRVKAGSAIEYRDPGWIELTFVAVSRNSGDIIRRTERLRVIKDDTPYHNDANPMDVDGDGAVTPLDPLIIINHINNRGIGTVDSGEGELGGDLDVDGDGRVSPLDILIIINELNSRRNSSGQGSSSHSNSNSGGGSLPEGEGSGVSGFSPVALQEEDLPGRRSRRLAR